MVAAHSDAPRDAELGPGLAAPAPDAARALVRDLVRSRRLDLRIAALTRQGRVKGAYYSSIGNEATGVGIARALEPRDVLVPTHRDLAAHLCFGHEPLDILNQYFKRRTSHTGGRDVGLHLGRPGTNIVAMVSHIGHMLPTALGCALAERARGTGAVALTTIGDGGTSTGDFHEALNTAAVLRLPVVVVIENNQWAYSTPNAQQFACGRLSDRAAGYGIAGEPVDGTDVLAVLDAARRAVARARAGGGPTLLESLTMRMRGHSEHDDASYVPPEMLERWSARDPVERAFAWAAARGFVDAAGREALEAAVEAEIDAAVAAAEAEPAPEPGDAVERAYAHWDAAWRPRLPPT